LIHNYLMANSIREQFTLAEIELSDRLAERHMSRGMLHADAVAAADLAVRWSKPTVERIRAALAFEANYLGVRRGS
jgi:hypothetical protein